MTDPSVLRITDKVAENESFGPRRLRTLDVSNSTLTGCDFAGISAETASLGGGQVFSTYVGCNFDGLKATNLFGGFSRFIECSFLNVRIEKWFGSHTDFVDCVWSGRLRRGIFYASVPLPETALLVAERLAARDGSPVTDEYRRLLVRRNEIRGNNFAQLEMVDVAFRNGIDLARQMLPKGDDYVYLPTARHSLEQARLAVYLWPDGDDRAVAHKVLDRLFSEVAGGQEQLLVRPSWYRKNRDIAKRVLDVAGTYTLES